MTVLQPVLSKRIVATGEAVRTGRDKGIVGPGQNAAWLPDSATTPNYLIRGTSDLLIQAAKYYDPSFAATQLGASAQTAGNGAIFANSVNLNKSVQPGQAGANPGGE